MPLDATTTTALQQHFPFLGGLPPQARRELERLGLPLALPAGTTVARHGDRVDALTLVTAGAVRLSMTGASGRELTLYRVRAGEACVLTATCVLTGHPFPARAEVEEALAGVAVPAPVVRRWVDETPGWRQFFFGLVARRLGEVLMAMEEVAFRRVDERLARALLARERDGVVQSTHRALAAELGTSREVVSRVLEDWSARGWVETGRGLVRIRAPAALAALLPDALGDQVTDGPTC